MAVAHDATSNNQGTGTSVTVSHTIASGSNRLLLVAVGIDASSNFNPTVTWNGVAMTQDVEITTNRYLSTFWLVAPDEGAHDVVVSSLPGGGNQVVFVRSFTGVDQSTPFDTAVQTNASTTNPSTINVDTVTGDLIVDFMYTNNVTGDFAAGGDQTVPTNGTVDLSSSDAGTSHRAGNGTLAMSWSWTGTASSAQIGYNLNQVASGSTTLSPAQAALTLNGRTATINSFSAVAIREVLINEAGSAVTNRTGISLLVWYAGNPVGAPDLSYSDLTTDANGTASWSLPTGGLTFNQAIFYVATDGHASLSEYTCARIIPTYS
jgi:hypothetical protein